MGVANVLASFSGDPLFDFHARLLEQFPKVAETLSAFDRCGKRTVLIDHDVCGKKTDLIRPWHLVFSGEDNREVVRVFLQEFLNDFTFLAHRNPHDGKFLVPIFLMQFIEGWGIGATRGAPGSPKIKKNRPAF